MKERRWINWPADISCPRPGQAFVESEVNEGKRLSVCYEGEVIGPVGKTQIVSEVVRLSKPLGKHEKPYIFMDIHGDEKAMSAIAMKNSEAVENEVILARWINIFKGQSPGNLVR